MNRLFDFAVFPVVCGGGGWKETGYGAGAGRSGG